QVAAAVRAAPWRSPGALLRRSLRPDRGRRDPRAGRRHRPADRVQFARRAGSAARGARQCHRGDSRRARTTVRLGARDPSRAGDEMIESGTLLPGKYRIAERLGEGGMGTVFRARDELLERDVAIKVLRADLAGRPGLLDRFRSEAMALARLAHPGIAALHGLERDGDQFYMVMEYV